MKIRCFFVTLVCMCAVLADNAGAAVAADKAPDAKPADKADKAPPDKTSSTIKDDKIPITDTKAASDKVPVKIKITPARGAPNKGGSSGTSTGSPPPAK